MTNETKIKVPKKYQHMVESICYANGFHSKYALTFYPEFSEGGAVFYSDSQADILEMIRLTYADVQESVPAPAPEEIEAPAIKEEIANVEETAPEDRNEQGCVPSEMAVDASAASPDQETKAAVVDDRRVAFTAIYSNGEIQTFFDGWSWRKLSQLVKWRLQYDRSVPETATVYAGDCGRLVRTFTNSPVPSVAPG